MKELFSALGKTVRVVDRKRMIFDFGNGVFYDIKGNIVPPLETIKYNDSDAINDDHKEKKEIVDKRIVDELIPESTIEPIYEIDDLFGNYGFKNKAGEFIIEPQYAYAYEFTCGLAAVNLNRTWYKNEDGRRFYENHFGFIDEHGKTVIPFAYDEAWPFNKYGVAVVTTLEDTFLIDTTGKTIPGTENLAFMHPYDYDERFLEFHEKGTDVHYIDADDVPVGLYDTKERKVILAPSIASAIPCSDDLILVYERGGEYGVSDFRQYYINSKGEKLYPWLNNKGFAIVGRPNKSLVTVVAVSKYTELAGNPSEYFSANGKKYKREFVYGLYSPKEFFILPLEYDGIREVTDNVFACLKDGTWTLIALDEGDY